MAALSTATVPTINSSVPTSRDISSSNSAPQSQLGPTMTSTSGTWTASAPPPTNSNIIYGQLLGSATPTFSTTQQPLSGYPAPYPHQPIPYQSLYTPPQSATPAQSSAARYTLQQQQRLSVPSTQPLPQRTPPPTMDPKVGARRLDGLIIFTQLLWLFCLSFLSFLPTIIII